MRRLLIIVSIILFLTILCCGSPPPIFFDEIIDWQKREAICLGHPESNLESDFSLEPIFRIIQRVNTTMKPIKEMNKRWQTSCQSLSRKEGDCDAFALLFWALLEIKKIVLSEDNRAAILYNDRIREYHMVNIVYGNIASYIVDTTGVISPCIQELSYFFEKNPQYSLILEFNLFSYFPL